MGNYNITNGVMNYFTIFHEFIDIMQGSVFTIGPVTFTLYQLFWSVVFFELFIYFLYRLLEGD